MNNGIFDTHAHYDHERYDYIRHAILSGMPELGVSLILNCGSNEDSSGFSVQLANEYPFVYAAAGIHPHEAARAAPGWEERIKQLLYDTKAVAVGEIGLDYYYNISDTASQKKVFVSLLELAVCSDLPVVIHDRDAHEDILSIIKEYSPKGVLHRFSGTMDMALELVDLGFYLGFGCSLTYDNADNERKIAAEIPVDRILLETDCPYLPPLQLRNELCRSDMISFAAEVISTLRPGYSSEQITDIARENGKRLFSI